MALRVKWNDSTSQRSVTWTSVRCTFTILFRLLFFFPSEFVASGLLSQHTHFFSLKHYIWVQMSNRLVADMFFPVDGMLYDLLQPIFKCVPTYSTVVSAFVVVLLVYRITRMMIRVNWKWNVQHGQRWTFKIIFICLRKKDNFISTFFFTCRSLFSKLHFSDFWCWYDHSYCTLMLAPSPHHLSSQNKTDVD